MSDNFSSHGLGLRVDAQLALFRATRTLHKTPQTRDIKTNLALEGQSHCQVQAELWKERIAPALHLETLQRSVAGSTYAQRRIQGTQLRFSLNSDRNYLLTLSMQWT